MDKGRPRCGNKRTGMTINNQEFYMKTICPTQQEMKPRNARFRELTPRAAHWNDQLGFPAEVLQLFTPKANYVLMAPASLPGRLSPNPAIVDGDKGVIRIGLAVAAPNDGPELHI